MAGHPRKQGPSSERVAANLRRIRKERGLSMAEVERRLAAVGQPLLATGILKTEQGDRAITVDELIAFAVVLGVTPNALLLPEWYSVSRNGVLYSYLVTPLTSADSADMWTWGTAERQLNLKDLEGQPLEVAPDIEPARFQIENAPHRYGRVLAEAEQEARHGAS